MLFERMSFQSHRNVCAGASGFPLGSMLYELGQNSSQARSPTASAVVDSMPGMFVLTRRFPATHWLTVVSGMPTSSIVRPPKASSDTQIHRVSPW